MQQPTPRPDSMYPGAVNDENIRRIFQGAGDFIARDLTCCGITLHAYMIDGLVSGSDASEYIVRPISDHCRGRRHRSCISGRWAARCTIPWPILAGIWIPLQKSW